MEEKKIKRFDIYETVSVVKKTTVYLSYIDGETPEDLRKRMIEIYDNGEIIDYSDYNDCMYLEEIENTDAQILEYNPDGDDIIIYDSASNIMDRINPDYYKNHPSGVECIDITKYHDFCTGNAIKYLFRAGLKTEEGLTNKEKEIEDLRKAIWYINKKIELLEK